MSENIFEKMSWKVIVFLAGIILLCKIGGSKFYLFNTLGNIAFFLLIVYLGYLLFKLLFMK